VRGSAADSGMMVKARIGRKRDYAEQLRRIGASISRVGVEESAEGSTSIGSTPFPDAFLAYLLQRNV